MMKLSKSLLVSALIPLLLAACGGKPSPDGTRHEPLTIKVTAEADTLIEGGTIAVKAEIGGSARSNAAIEWRSSGGGSFADGSARETEFTAPPTEGPVTITATATVPGEEPATGSRELAVVVPLRLVAINPSAGTTGIGGTLTLEAELDGFYASEATVAWTYMYSGAGEPGQLSSTEGPAVSWQAPFTEGAGHEFTVTAHHGSHDGGSKTTALQVTFCNEGSYTVDDPCVISNLHQLQGIATKPERLKGHYLMASDIDATATQEADWENGNGFLPIGMHPNAEEPFTGSLDGAGHRIDGLRMEYPGDDAIGIIRALTEGAEIRRLQLSNFEVSGKDFVGALVGVVQEGVVADVELLEGSVKGRDGIGGVGGLLDAAARIKDSSVSNITVTGQNIVGGVAGLNAGLIEEIEVHEADIEAAGTAGGLLGGNTGTIQEVRILKAAVHANGHTAGGLAGTNGAGGRIEKSFVGSSVISATGNNVGGAVGLNFTASLGLAEVRAENNGVVGTGNAQHVGGLIGTNHALVTDSQVDGGSVQAEHSRVGGFVGFNSSAGNITDSSAKGQHVSSSDTTVGTNVGGFVGRNEGEIEGARVSEQEITGYSHTGGFAGANDTAAKIHTSAAENSMVTSTGSGRAGGFIYLNDGEITTSHAKEVGVRGSTILGGFVGWNRETGDISESFALSTADHKAVRADNHIAGGFAGSNDGAISRSWSAVYEVAGAGSVGGFIGSLKQNPEAQVSESYSMTPLSVPAGAPNAGGFIGMNQDINYANVADSFWTSEVAGVNVSAGGTGRTLAQMRDGNTYVAQGWSFTGANPVWRMPGTDNPEDPGTPDLIRNSRF